MTSRVSMFSLVLQNFLKWLADDVEGEMLAGNMIQGPCHPKMLWFTQVQGEAGQRKFTVDCEWKHHLALVIGTGRVPRAGNISVLFLIIWRHMLTATVRHKVRASYLLCSKVLHSVQYSYVKWIPQHTLLGFGFFFFFLWVSKNPFLI